MPGKFRKVQERSGKVRKGQERSGNVRKCQEMLGMVRKGQENQPHLWNVCVLVFRGGGKGITPLTNIMIFAPKVSKYIVKKLTAKLKHSKLETGSKCLACYVLQICVSVQVLKAGRSMEKYKMNNSDVLSMQMEFSAFQSLSCNRTRALKLNTDIMMDHLIMF
jgi:hypothetical protein